MPTTQILNKQATINAAEDYLLTLCETIFWATDLSKVDKEIEDASKIRFGLLALNNLTEESNLDEITRIVVGLNKMCKIYNQQSINNITI